MKNLIILIHLFIISGLPAAAAENFFDHAEHFLATYVHDGRIDYETIYQNPERLEALTREIAEFNLGTLPEGNPQKAFWINAYNILVIKGIIDHYPTDSPLSIPGFFKEIKYPAAGESLTLDEIEHERIRAVYGDARIHFALVCAARGCPPLRSRAYRPETLDAQLETSTRQILNDPAFIRIDPAKKSAAISEIFKWFRGDFENSGATVRDFINRYLTGDIPEDFTITFYSYDWKLNTSHSVPDTF